jgi:predicted DNA-binding transcriptional regulator AlpA
MTLRENEIGRPQHRDRVFSFREWCSVNGFSKATGQRLLRAGEGPPVLQLSSRRIGIRVADNATWQASRVRKD